MVAQHYTLFPLALGQILREYAITELHLTLNAGKWNYDDWGYPGHGREEATCQAPVPRSLLPRACPNYCNLFLELDGEAFRK